MHLKQSKDSLSNDLDTVEPTGLEIANISKSFNDLQALENINLNIGAGEIVAICGPSGAGKTTLGRLISGLEYADNGDIHVDKICLSDLPPQKRRVAHMFESLALYPTRTVFANIASPLKSPSHQGRFTQEQIDRRVNELMSITGIEHLGKRLPSELSGGQKQRVALCRTLVQDPSLFILDEPIGHLDAKLRHRLRGEIRRRQKALKVPTLWLTPDAVEAMAVADRVVMLIDGKIVQIGSPAEVYAKPKTTNIARLVGDPAMNLLDLWLQTNKEATQILCNGVQMQTSTEMREKLFSSKEIRLTIGFPPKRTKILTEPSSNSVAGEIYTVEPFGKYALVTADIKGAHVKSKMPPDFRMDVGTPIFIGIPTNNTLLFEDNTGNLIETI